MKQKIKQLLFVVISKRLLKYAILPAVIVSQSSCFQHFYKTNTATQVETLRLKQLDDQNKYFIVHTPAEVFELKNLRVDSATISGERIELNTKYEKYLNPRVAQANSFTRRDSGMVFSEVHLYTREMIGYNRQVNLSSSQIFRMDVYGPDKAADKRSRVISIIGIAIVPAAAVVLAVIAVASLDNAFNSISLQL